MLSKIDLDYLSSVQNLSLRHIGLTKNNPSVACIVVDFTNDIKGKVLSYGITATNGRPHAEAIALKNIRKKKFDYNLTAYISLEPCFKLNAHSCSKLLSSYGIKKIIIDSLDPNKTIYKKGLSFLKKNNHIVLLNKDYSKFKDINKSFYVNQLYNRPFITLKIAVSKNGYSKNSFSKNITDKNTQHYMHHLRLKHDAIGIGYNTLIEDAPKLTCRLQGIDKKMKKIIFTNRDIESKVKDLNFIKISTDNDFKKNLYKQLMSFGINSLLVEGGASTFKVFLKFGIFDEIYLTISENKTIETERKYKINNFLFKDLKKISNNYYGKDQIIVYKNTNV